MARWSGRRERQGTVNPSWDSLSTPPPWPIGAAVARFQTGRGRWFKPSIAHMMSRNEAMQCLEALLAELPAEFSRHPGTAESRGSFRVIKESNVRRVHEALWGLQVYFGMQGPDALADTPRAIPSTTASPGLRVQCGEGTPDAEATADNPA